jgi:hypothetical protein
MGGGLSATRPALKLEDQDICFCLSYHLDLSGMGGPSSSYATASITLRLIWPRKPHHQVEVGIPLGGSRFHMSTILRYYAVSIYIDMLSPVREVNNLTCFLFVFMLQSVWMSYRCVSAQVRNIYIYFFAVSIFISRGTYKLAQSKP